MVVELLPVTTAAVVPGVEVTFDPGAVVPVAPLPLPAVGGAALPPGEEEVDGGDVPAEDWTVVVVEDGEVVVVVDVDVHTAWRTSPPTGMVTVSPFEYGVPVPPEEVSHRDST